MQLGQNEDQANFNMLRQCEEYNALEGPVTNMMRKNATPIEDKQDTNAN